MSEEKDDLASSKHPAGQTDSIPLPEIELRVLHALRQIIQAVETYSRTLSKNYQITTPQLVFLKEVVDDSSQSIAAISRKIHLSPSTVVGIVDRLEKKGWVRRERDTKDRRIVHVVATDAGRDIARNAPGPLHQTLADGLNRLSRDERVVIADSLEKIVQLMYSQDLGTSTLTDDDTETATPLSFEPAPDHTDAGPAADSVAM